MDKLWAPWRIKYVSAKKSKGCIFCKARKGGGKSYVVRKTAHSIAMLNIYPYNNGHMMICPKRHVRDLALLKQEEVLDLFALFIEVKKRLDKVIKPHGYNIGINLERSAGAGIAHHLHIHIVLRWNGDTNFMPVLFSTKVISQSLDELYSRLKHAQAK